MNGTSMAHSGRLVLRQGRHYHGRECSPSAFCSFISVMSRLKEESNGSIKGVAGLGRGGERERQRERETEREGEREGERGRERERESICSQLVYHLCNCSECD